MMKSNSVYDIKDLSISSEIVLYVVKIPSKKKKIFKEERQDSGKKLDYFKMKFDCSKCDLESEEGNDASLREFRERVKEDLDVNGSSSRRSEGAYSIYDKYGIRMTEEDFQFLNSDNHREAIVYVSRQ